MVRKPPWAGAVRPGMAQAIFVGTAKRIVPRCIEWIYHHESLRNRFPPEGAFWLDRNLDFTRLGKVMGMEAAAVHPKDTTINIQEAIVATEEDIQQKIEEYELKAGGMVALVMGGDDS